MGRGGEEREPICGRRPTFLLQWLQHLLVVDARRRQVDEREGE